MTLASLRGHRGFTLIELLVVIAIIGILSAVVLASLNSARSKGIDAAVVSNLSAIQTQAELYYQDNGNSYGTQALGNCPTTGTVSNMFGNTTIRAALVNSNSTMGATGNDVVQCTAAGTTFMANMKLRAVQGTNTAKYFCVDSTGNATTTTTVPSGAACPV